MCAVRAPWTARAAPTRARSAATCCAAFSRLSAGASSASARKRSNADSASASATEAPVREPEVVVDLGAREDRVRLAEPLQRAAGAPPPERGDAFDQLRPRRLRRRSLEGGARRAPDRSRARRRRARARPAVGRRAPARAVARAARQRSTMPSASTPPAGARRTPAAPSAPAAGRARAGGGPRRSGRGPPLRVGRVAASGGTAGGSVAVTRAARAQESRGARAAARALVQAALATTSAPAIASATAGAHAGGRGAARPPLRRGRSRRRRWPAATPGRRAPGRRATSTIDDGRSPGPFDSIQPTRSASQAGSPGATVVRGGAARCMCAVRSSWSDARTNGGGRSASRTGCIRARRCPPDGRPPEPPHCSGDMYSGVPTTSPRIVSRAAPSMASSFATPKSSTLRPAADRARTPGRRCRA